MFKDLVKTILFRVSPRAATAIMSARARAHSHQLIREWEIDKLNGKLLNQLGSNVLTGPFAGMALSPMTFNEHIGPFLLGTYESELHEWISSLSTRTLQQIVDIGAKFGYYAVGLARIYPDVPTISFDTDPWARRALKEMCDANAITNVSIKGYCTPKWLEHNIGTGTFIFSDCEGGEAFLFLNTDTLIFRECTMLIEVHEEFAPGVTKHLTERFTHTHDIKSVSSHDPGPPDLDLTFLTTTEGERAVREIRGPQEWLFFTPRGA